MIPMTSEKPKLTDPRSFAFILVGTALPILIALVTKSWASGRGDTIAVGPSGAEICLASTCASVSFSKLGMGGEVGAFAVLSIIAGIAAIATAALFGGLALANKSDKLPPFVVGHAAFGAAAFAMFVFALRVGGGDEVSLSWGPLFGLGGVGAGWYMFRRLQKTLPAKVAAFAPVVAGTSTDNERMFGGAAAPVAAAPTPTASAAPTDQPTRCPKCKGPVEYIPQYQRSWCAKCRQYA